MAKNNKFIGFTVAFLVVLMLVAGAWAVRLTRAEGQSDLTPTCDSGSIQGQLSGLLSIEDAGGSFDPTPIIKDVEVYQLTQQYFSLFRTKYDVNVELHQNGKVLGHDGFSGKIATFDIFGRITSKKHPYNIKFYMEDNDCDGRLDPFNAELVVKLTPKGKPADTLQKHLQYIDGEVILS